MGGDELSRISLRVNIFRLVVFQACHLFFERDDFIFIITVFTAKKDLRKQQLSFDRSAYSC
jgi:hypothetical protein